MKAKRKAPPPLLRQLTRAVDRALDEHQLREIRLRYLGAGGLTRWRAEGLLHFHKVREKAVADGAVPQAGSSMTMAEVEAWMEVMTEKPALVGQGDDPLAAIMVLTPVTWTFRP